MPFDHGFYPGFVSCGAPFFPQLKYSKWTVTYDTFFYALLKYMRAVYGWGGKGEEYELPLSVLGALSEHKLYEDIIIIVKTHKFLDIEKAIYRKTYRKHRRFSSIVYKYPFQSPVCMFSMVAKNYLLAERERERVPTWTWVLFRIE